MQKMENLIGGAYTNTLDQEAPDQDERGGGCTGANVVGCFSDVYSNHGWASLAAGITSAFIPQTAVAFALACAAKNGC
ncbi:hypothetical protein ACHRVK_07685 [Flavobacterium plurextorum]|uniref:hypothetical protein n=1 Tax=Flavobacterium TaxID=237 RepID=UPI0037565003